ncbi:hypothetical protein GEV33_008717 [Tenebrio molitor]|uniref:E2 ubiquitin-conjugating enzyme n=1 Tax=Tenebrio molitor TaxID=7067 RepID=A0A8J6HH76_TENMO|nr:hypothetical protein GEV33_008717 [Tenebrio molitor]
MRSYLLVTPAIFSLKQCLFEPQSALLLRKQLAGKPSKEYFSHTKNQHNYKKSDTPRRHQTTPKSPHSRGISPKTPRQLDPAPASPGQKRRNPKKSAPGTERPGPQRLAAERGGRLRGEAPRLSHFQFSPNCQKKFDICGELNKNPVEGFSAGLIDDNDIYRWEVLIIGPPDTLYEGGFFKCHLYFPKEYPLRPPKMKFVTEIWHPNIDKNGDVCISILHEPGDDKFGYEKASERWLPVHTVETILISVISMLADPNDESPANVDAAKEWREMYGEFKRKVARCVRKSQEEC